MREVSIPSLGLALTEVLLVSWHKQAGDDVVQGELVAEIETDKVNTEVASPCDGKVGRLLYEEGQMVPVGASIVRILENGETDDGGASDVRQHPEPAAAASSAPLDTPSTHAEGERLPHRLSPRQRRELAEVEQQTARAPDGPPGDADAGRAPAGRYRALIAAKVTQSWTTIPHFAVSREIDVDGLMAVHARERSIVGNLTFTDLLLRVYGEALRETTVAGHVNVGLAVSTPGGVVIPCISDVLDGDLATLAVKRTRAIERARGAGLDETDVTTEMTTTLSNLGPQGVDRFTGVIALGHTSILTVGRIQERLALSTEGVMLRHVIDATLNVDHRAMDGTDAAALLAALANAARDSAAWHRGAA